jgi:O-methyltransferase
MAHLIKKVINTIFANKGYHVAHNMEKVLRRKRRINMISDFVRQSSLELISEEIYNKKISGNVAELGVYKGDFSILINQLFPDRKLYLFDTFEGFASVDVAIDKKNGYSSFDQDFSETSVNYVLSKMQKPENCIVKKGYFPDTAKDIEDCFVFVSLDTDLYEPIYQGLIYFYPRLVKGGYIFIHDYNNMRYKGVREAVLKFCAENDISIFPLSDACGSAIMIK